MIDFISSMAEEETVPVAKVGKYSRNRSIMAVTDNPFEVAALMDGLHVEVLTDAVLADDGKFGEEVFNPIKAIRFDEVVTIVLFLKLFFSVLLLVRTRKG